MKNAMKSALSRASRPRAAGREAAELARSYAGDAPPRLAIVFASPTHDPEEVLRGVNDVVGQVPVVGCTSAGEFAENEVTDGGVGVTLLSGGDVEVRTGVGEDFSRDLEGAVRGAVAGFVGRSVESLRRGYLGRTILVFADGLTGRLEDLIDELMRSTAGQYQLAGGAAADDARFQKTSVFSGDRVLSGAFVCVELLTRRPVALGFSHGWRPAGPPLRVTAAEGALLKELNGRPAWEIYRELAEEQDLAVSEGGVTPFLIEHLLGIQLASGEYKLRVPLFKRPDGSLVCAAEVPEGALVRVMESTADSVIESGGRAVELARRHLGDGQAAGALVFECVSTRLRLGPRFEQELDAMKRAMGGASVAGYAGYGQLARVRGEFSGLMDATALACLIPE